MYFDRMDSMLEAHKRLWRYVEDDENPKITEHFKMDALSLIINPNEVIFNMINYGPGMMELNRLQNTVKGLKENLLRDKNEDGDEAERYYEEGEVVTKPGYSPYVYHSSEYLQKIKLGTVTEEEKKAAEERTNSYWDRFKADKNKQWEVDR